ncbi:MAG: efflux RND transporter permease subunit [Actinomycetota bacterium]|nr:efflux RND transporter permease subunit [Actinomycetota bacterium]
MSLKSRGVVIALGAVVMVVGVLQLRNMPRDVLPEFSPTTVEVQTEALGLSAEEVEQLVTVPLEQDLLNGVAFLDVIRSESVPGLSHIEMIFEPGTDLARARQVVNERLTQAHALPNVSQPPQMLQPLSSTSRVMMIALSSEDLSLIDMSQLARWTIRPKLMGVEGVANVSVWGNREEQLQVRVDPARLQEAGVTLDQIISTAGNALWVSPLTFLEASTPGTGGFFDTQSQRLGVQHVQPIETPEDLAGVTIEDSPGATPGSAPAQRLGDVTTVVEDHQPLIGDAVFTDGPGLLLVVEKFPEANALEVTRDLDSALDDLAPGLSEVQVDSSFFRPARYIEQSSDNLRTALAIGLAILVLALGALLFDLRIAFVSLVAVLLSMAAAVGLLSLRGETLNPMVLAGLVLALVVLIDDAVVSADGARRGLGRNGDDGAEGPSAPRRLVAAVVAGRGPLVYATLVLLLALVPMLVLDGEVGAFLPPLALSYAGAVVVSMLVALTVTPALSLLLLSGAPVGGRTSPLLGWFGARHDRALARFTGTARPGLLVAVALVVLGLVTLPFLDRGDSLVPELKDRDLLIQWSGAPGTSLPEMSRITARAARELKTLPGVDNVGGHAGRAVLGDQVVGVNSSELWATIDPEADYERTKDSIEEVVNGYPGVDRSVLTYGRERIEDVLKTPDGVEGKDLTVRVFGQDLEVLRSRAEEVEAVVAGVDGVEDPRLVLPVLEPTLQVEVDLERAQFLGISPGDVRRTAATALSGTVVGNLFDRQQIFEVVVWGTPETRNSLDNVRQLLIETPAGGQVRLDEVADVAVTPSPNVISHDDVSRNIDVGVNVNGRDLGAVASDIREGIRAINFPIEYHAELLGDYEDSQAARRTFIAVTAAAVLGIFLLLQAAFGSWRMASVAILALPGALAGGAVAALVDGDAVTVGSVAGFVAVLGLAVRHSLLFARRSQELEDHDGVAYGPELVRRAAADRLEPTLISAVTTGLVFLPLLFFGGLAGHELVHPMAAVVLGGLVTSTLVSLFVVPALYLRFGLRSEGGREQFDMVLDLTAAERGQEVTPVPTTINA